MKYCFFCTPKSPIKRRATSIGKIAISLMFTILQNNAPFTRVVFGGIIQ